MIPLRFSFRLLALCGVAILAACGTPKDTYLERPVETLYNGAMDQLFADGTYASIFKKYFPTQEMPSYASCA